MTNETKSQVPDRKCERCKQGSWNKMWSPDGLGGHEILVCDPCYADLSAQAKTTYYAIYDA